MTAGRRYPCLLYTSIPSYKLEKDVVDAEIEVLRQMGVDIRCGVEVGRDLSLIHIYFCIYAQYIIIIFRQTAAFLSLFLPFHRR